MFGLMNKPDEYTAGAEKTSRRVGCRYGMELPRIFRRGILLGTLLLASSSAFAQTDTVSAQSPDTASQESADEGYRIDQPGTITFTVGVKISGKVEKPQVVIFLPKEKTLYRKEVFDRSYREELGEPLPYTPPAW